MQVGSDLLQLRADRSRWLRKASDFEKSENAETMLVERKQFAAANLLDKFVVVSGGLSGEDTLLNSVERYDVAGDTWEALPNL